MVAAEAGTCGKSAGHSEMLLSQLTPISLIKGSIFLCCHAHLQRD
jgi:hypothetical protein